MADWSTLKVLRPWQFSEPNKVNFDLVLALDLFAARHKLKPSILSDYRPGDPRQHGQGRAIDASFPDANPLEVWELAQRSRLFSGLGVYINDKGIASFHFDNRPDRSVASPALWGGLIRSFGPADKGELRNDTLYVSADRVIDRLKKKATWLWVLLAALGVALFAFRRRKLST